MHIELLSPEEALKVIAKMKDRDDRGYPSFSLKGHLTAICREKKTGEEVWKVDQDNIITDWGKYLYVVNGAGLNDNIYLFLSASTELPDPRRNTVVSQMDSSDWALSPRRNVAGSSSIDHSKWWTWTFDAPTPAGTNRTIGTIGLQHDGNYQQTQVGIWASCYTRISPVKIQSSTQTVELTYKIYFQAAM